MLLYQLDDLSLSGDFKVVIPHNNTTYFNIVGTGVWNNATNEFFINGNVNDYPVIFDDEWIPNFDWGYQGPGISIHPGSGQLVYYTSYYGNWGNPNYWEVALSTSGYPARDNGGDNLTFVNAMRLNRPSIQIVPPASPQPSTAGTTLNFTIKFGTEVPVYNAVGVSFKFRRGWQDYFRLKGSFYTSPTQSLFTIGSAFVDTLTESGVINFAAIRNSNTETYTGTGGTITTLPIEIVQELPNAANVNFFLTDIYTLDNTGEYIPLTQVTYQYNITFLSAVSGNMIYRVGKGDSDHDGDVDANDVAALALRFGEQGGAVQGIINWNTCSVITRDPWGVDAGRNPSTDILAVWCDHNGDGRVGNLDVLQIGFCWGSSYSYAKRQPSIVAESNSLIKLRLYDEFGKIKSLMVAGKTYDLIVSIDKLNFVSAVIFEFNVPANTEILNYSIFDDFKIGSNDFIEFVKQEGQKLTFVLARPLIYGEFSGNDIKFIKLTLRSTSDSNLENIVESRIMDKNGFFYKVRINDKALNSIPENFNLSQNYPNPFNPKTVIKFDLPEDSKISLKVYNSLGELVQTIIDNQTLVAGSYEKDFDASQLPSGIYLYRLSSDKFTATRKMILMK